VSSFVEYPSDRRIEIELPDPFNVTETLAYLGRSEKECLFHLDDQNHTVTRLISVGEVNVITVLQFIRSNPAVLRVTFGEDLWPERSVRSAIVQYIRQWFDLDTDLRPFYDQVSQCPLLHGLSQRYHGLRIIGIPDLFEALCWAVIGQQVNLSFAYTVKYRLVTAFGSHKQWQNRAYWRFPEPAVLANVQPEDLQSLQLTRRKSEYIVGIAQKMAEDSLSKQDLLNLGDFSRAEDLLLSIRGIGPWTASYVLMRCLRDPSAFPVGDAGLQNAVKQHLALTKKPTAELLRELASVWAGWEAYATFYLWQSLASSDVE
jgi:DNA-3-methyladenine glycosylase II